MQDDPKDIDTRLCSARVNADGTIVVSQVRWNLGRGSAMPNGLASARNMHHRRTHYALESPQENLLHSILRGLGLR